MSDNKNSLSSANRLIVKVGSALLTTDDAEGLNQDWLDALADDVATYVSNGTQVIIVSSGAVAVGRQALSLSETALRLEEKQAAAERDIGKLYSEECSWTKPSVPEKDSDAIHVWREWDKYMHPDTLERWWYNRNTGEAIYVPPWTLPQCDRGCKLKKPQCDPFRYQ